jgi:type I restriction-modification system DNA methylase subunit
MGRTVPSFRIAEAQEFGEWKGFRKALPKRERRIFDEMLNESRLYTSASSAAVRTSRFEGMAMAIIFHHYRVLAGCAEALREEGRDARPEQS